MPETDPKHELLASPVKYAEDKGTPDDPHRVYVGLPENITPEAARYGAVRFAVDGRLWFPRQSNDDRDPLPFVLEAAEKIAHFILTGERDEQPT